MRSIDEIPKIEDQDERLNAITVDCYGMHEELAAFEVYFTDAPTYPFDATWRDVDEPDHAENITVMGVADVDDRRGVLLSIKRGDKHRRVVAEQLWASDAESANATILNDYRYWLNNRGGMSVGPY